MERNTEVQAFDWTLGLSWPDYLVTWTVFCLGILVVADILLRAFGKPDVIDGFIRVFLAIKRSRKAKPIQVTPGIITEALDGIGLLQVKLAEVHEEAIVLFLKFSGDRYTNIMVNAEILLHQMEGGAKATLAADLERLQSLEQQATKALSMARSEWLKILEPTEGNLNHQIGLWGIAVYKLGEATSLLEELEQFV